MNIKRFTTALIGFPIVAAVFIWGNTYLIDVALSIVAILSLYEYFHAVKQKAKPVEWLGYVAAIGLAFIHLIPTPDMALKIVAGVIPMLVLILFATIILTKQKYNLTDIALTFFGIVYVVGFLLFLSLIREMPDGHIWIWFVFFTAWGTDVFAYFAGKTIGKHKFTEISPNKTIEGCVGGTIGAIVLSVVFAVVCNTYWQMNISYIAISMIALVLSIIGQIGDLSASAIKRYVGIKDFSELIPGHGGMLDRIDSVLFIAPFAYFLLSIL